MNIFPKMLKVYMYLKYIEDIDFFGVRSIFISSNEHQKLYFHEWRTPNAVFSRVAKPRVKIPLLVFMSDIKINLTTEKIKFGLNVEKINLFQSVSRHHRKVIFLVFTDTYS